MLLSKLLKLLILFTLFHYQLAFAQAPTPLVILNWSEYLNEEMVAAFEKEHNATVKHIYFESDDERDKILLQTNASGYDLILVNGAAFDSYIRKGYLAPIDFSNINNIKFIDDRWRSAFRGTKDYGMPYFWGTLGIAYRKDLVKEPITSWKQFFNPSPELQGKLLMVKSSRDVIGMALKSLGYSANSEDRDENLAAEQLLLRLKPHIAKFGYITLSRESAMVSGDIVAATIFGGDALNVAEHNENIVYVLPEEGGNIWVDYFTISSLSRNKELAHAFLDFINRPEWAAKNAEEMYLATTNNAAQKLLSEELLNDPIIYPDKKALSNSEFYTPLSPRASRTRSTFFSRLVE